jgi:hypothetical protein
MACAFSSVASRAPVFVVEAIGEDGFAWLHGPMQLLDALEISQRFAECAPPGKEPRILIPPPLVGVGLADDEDDPS